eukprot:gene5678-7837_t
MKEKGAKSKTFKAERGTAKVSSDVQNNNHLQYNPSKALNRLFDADTTTNIEFKKSLSKFDRDNGQNEQQPVIDNTKNNGKKTPKMIAAHKKIKETKAMIKISAIKTAAAEILLPSTEGFIELEDTRDKTIRLKQKDILDNVDLNTAKNSLDLKLTEFGPYSINYSLNGRYLLFGGKRGHVATIDCRDNTVGMELQLQETVHDVHYLHNETLFAVAQNKYTYIYDKQGVEIHCMTRHERPYKLDFLPYHFLLTTIGQSGWIKWHDISTGQYINGYSTGHGPTKVLRHNHINAVSHCGHSNGVVSLWSPNSGGKALVNMFCHAAPITDLAIDRQGRYMVTSGLEGLVKIWDLRTLTTLHTFKPKSPVMSLDISDKDLISIGFGRTAHVLKDAFTKAKDSIYLTHSINTSNAILSAGAGATASARAIKSNVAISHVSFRPYEDVLGIGHTHGLTTMIVPGAGESNFDSFESNPFMNLRQRRENEVQSLLGKLNYEMIGLDASFVGSVTKDKAQLEADQKQLFYNANKSELEKKGKKEKNRQRGKNKISAKLARKHKNIIDAQLLKLKEAKLQQQLEKASSSETNPLETQKFAALDRFSKKPYSPRNILSFMLLLLPTLTLVDNSSNSPRKEKREIATYSNITFKLANMIVELIKSKVERSTLIPVSFVVHVED